MRNGVSGGGGGGGWREWGTGKESRMPPGSLA